MFWSVGEFMGKRIVVLSLMVTLIFFSSSIFATPANKIDPSLNFYLKNYVEEKNILSASKNIFSVNSMNNNFIQKIPVIIKISENVSLADVYNSLQKQGAEIKYSFQLIDSIAADVSFNLIERLVNHKDIKKIYLDREIYLELINQTQEKDTYESFESNSYKRPNEENSYLPLLNESSTYINAPYLWDLGIDGEGVKIAILDTGIDYTHPDLSGKVIASRDFTLFDNELKSEDGHGHGTHVAGTVAGTGIASKKITGTSSTDTSGLVNLPYFPNIYHVGYEELPLNDEESPDFYNILVVKNLPSEGEIYLRGIWPDNYFDFETNSINNRWREYDFSFDNSTQKLYGGYQWRAVLDMGEVSMNTVTCPENNDYYDYNSSEKVYKNHTYCIYTSKENYVKIKILENNSDSIRFKYKWQSPEPSIIFFDKDGNFNTKDDQYFASDENHLHKSEKICYSSGYCYYRTSPLMVSNLSSDLNSLRVLIDFNGDNIPDYMRGVAPGASLLNAKVLSDYGGGYDSGIIAGIEWAVANKADIISLSLGGWENICDGNDPLSEAVEKASDLNVTVVIAVGNSGWWGRETLGSPGCADKIITVGAISKDYYYNAEIADFSSQGPSADGRIKPEILAPGVGIIAPQAKDTSMGYSPLNGYTSASGTSMATPHISGAIALLKQANPSLTPNEIKEILMSTSRDLKGESVFRQGAGIVDLYYAYHYNYSPKVSPSVLNLIINNKETKTIDLENSYYGTLKSLPYKDELNKFTDFFNGEVDQTTRFYYNFTIPEDTLTFTVYISWINKSNDVDMKLKTPSENYYYSTSGFRNYEEITLESPESGEYSLEVYPWWVQEEVEVDGILTYNNLIEWDWFDYNSGSEKLEIKSNTNKSGLYAGKLFLINNWNWTYTMIPASIILSEYLDFIGEINHSYFVNPCNNPEGDDKITWSNFGSSEKSYASFDGYFCEELIRKAYSFEITENLPYFDIFLNWWTPSNSYYEDLRIFIYNPKGELYDSIDYYGKYESSRIYYPSSGNWTLVVESEYAGENGIIFSGEISIPSIILDPSILDLNLRQGENSLNELEITNTLNFDLDLSIDRIIWEEAEINVLPNSNNDNSTQDQFSYSYNYYSFNISQEQIDNYLKSKILIDDNSIYKVGTYIFDAEGGFVDYVYNYDNELTTYHQIPNSAVPGLWTMVLFAEGFDIGETPIDLRLFSLNDVEWNWTEVTEPSSFFKGKDKAIINITVPNDYPSGESIAFLSLVEGWWKGDSSYREFYKPLSLSYPIFMDISEAECHSDIDCDNNFYCDGIEKCIQGICVNGDSIVCNDSVVCTNDFCDEISDSCQFLPDDSNCEESFFCDPLDDCQINEVIIIDYPEDGGVYSERSFVLSANIDKDVDWFYEIKGRRSRLKKICNKISICEKKIRFNEGLNELSINTKDHLGDYEQKLISFIIDSKSPRISRTEPQRGFSDGNFKVEFREDNPEKLILFYGNSIMNKFVDLKRDCDEGRRSFECSVKVNLSDFDGKELKYWFELEDIAGNKDISREQYISIDMTPPLLNNPDSFWKRGTGRYDNYLFFNISIIENNFDEVILSYEYERRGRIYKRERRLCSRLRDGICEKRFRIRDSYSDLKIIIRDEAGNEVVEGIDL